MGEAGYIIHPTYRYTFPSGTCTLRGARGTKRGRREGKEGEGWGWGAQLFTRRAQAQRQLRKTSHTFPCHPASTAPARLGREAHLLVEGHKWGRGEGWEWPLAGELSRTPIEQVLLSSRLD